MFFCNLKNENKKQRARQEEQLPSQFSAKHEVMFCFWLKQNHYRKNVTYQEVCYGFGSPEGISLSSALRCWGLRPANLQPAACPATLVGLTEGKKECQKHRQALPCLFFSLSGSSSVKRAKSWPHWMESPSTREDFKLEHRSHQSHQCHAPAGMRDETGVQRERLAQGAMLLHVLL